MHKEYLYCPFCSSRLNIKIEEQKERKYCANCKWTYYPKPDIAVAGVAIEIGQDTQPLVLMVRRKRQPFSGTWMFPAGFLESGEHPEETLVRELEEETGLKVTEPRLLKVIKAVSDPRSPGHLVFFYQIKAIGEIANNDKDENSDIEWRSIYDDVDIGFPHHRIIFNELRSIIK